MDHKAFEAEALHWFIARVAFHAEARFRSEATDGFGALYQCPLVSEMGPESNAIVLRNYKGVEVAFEADGDAGEDANPALFSVIEVGEAWNRIRTAERERTRQQQGSLF